MGQSKTWRQEYETWKEVKVGCSVCGVQVVSSHAVIHWMGATGLETSDFKLHNWSDGPSWRFTESFAGKTVFGKTYEKRKKCFTLSQSFSSEEPETKLSNKSYMLRCSSSKAIPRKKRKPWNPAKTVKKYSSRVKLTYKVYPQHIGPVLLVTNSRLGSSGGPFWDSKSPSSKNTSQMTSPYL